MPRYNYKKLRYNDQEKLLNLLVEVLYKLKTKQGVANFLKDSLNRSERLMLARRLLIAVLLERGETYRDIQKQLKVGKSTIARTERWLNFGRGGFKKAVKIVQNIIT